MLDYDKIHSDINFDRTSKPTLAKYLEIPYTTLMSRLSSQNLTPNDIEKIAEFFSRPIAYYFNKTDAITTYEDQQKCKDCEKKDKIINAQKEIIATLEKLNMNHEKYITVLEKKENTKLTDETEGV